MIPVTDGVGRPRSLLIQARTTGVVVVPPPGGGCTVSPDKVEMVREALAAARSEALRGGGW